LQLTGNGFFAVKRIRQRRRDEFIYVFYFAFKVFPEYAYSAIEEIVV
jgi:hypothetical protein